jgi:hypothetical protein
MDIDSMQVLAGRMGDGWQDALYKDASPMHLMERTNASLTIMNCIQVCHLPRWQG